MSPDITNLTPCNTLTGRGVWKLEVSNLAHIWVNVY